MSDVTQGLKRLLANSYFLYLKTQNFHWNIQGEDFFEFHELFETHYTELADAIDVIAEAIRVLQERAPGSFKEFSALTDLEETPHDLASHDMMAMLLHDHQVLVKNCSDVASACLAAGDHGSYAIVTDRLKSHQKIVWMLQAWSA